MFKERISRKLRPEEPRILGKPNFVKPRDVPKLHTKEPRMPVKLSTIKANVV